MGNDWTDKEVELTIEDYFSMLKLELLNKPYNKTISRKALAQLLNNRSHGSIEFKRQNISAVLMVLGLPYIKGYKPLHNYQQIINKKLVDYIQKEKENLISHFDHFAQNIGVVEISPDFNKILSAPPEIQMVDEPSVDYQRRPIKINYIEKEQQNVTLGLKGEELIFKYEKWRLINEGNESLANTIEWVSKYDDGAGFDILSKNKNGTDRYVEVKTTKLSKESPFYFSKNEYEFSKKGRQNYYLYRLYNFSDSPKLFYLNGDFDSFCVKEATQYKGFFNKQRS